MTAMVTDISRREWRCGSSRCVVKPLLGLVDDGGRVQVRLAGRTRHPRQYVIDPLRGVLLAHCPSCHEWRLWTGMMTRKGTGEERWEGPPPAMACEGCVARTAREDRK